MGVGHVAFYAGEIFSNNVKPIQFFRHFSVIVTMKKWHFLWLSLLYFCSIPRLYAQWEEPPGQYWAVRSHYNPSLAGETEAINTSALYRYSWNGIKNAPRQLYLTANMPFEFFGMRHGAGVTLYNESIGDLHNSLLAFQYSWKKRIGTNYLNVGLQAGVYDLHFDAESKTFFEEEPHNRKTVKVTPVDKQVIDLNAGISWTGETLFVSLSTLHITQPRFYTHPDFNMQSDSAQSVITRSLNLMTGYNITHFYPLEIQPLLWVLTDLNTTQVQATLRMEYNKKFSGGASWRKDDGYHFFVGNVFHGAEWGYTYGLHTMGVGKSSRGSHEVYVRYAFSVDYFKPKRFPHKSIRLL